MATGKILFRKVCMYFKRVRQEFESLVLYFTCKNSFPSHTLSHFSLVHTHARTRAPACTHAPCSIHGGIKGLP